MTLVTQPVMVDDDDPFTAGTLFQKSFVELLYAQMDAQFHSSTNATTKPKTITDEVVTARGSRSSLNDRLSTSFNADGTLKRDSIALSSQYNALTNSDTSEFTAHSYFMPGYTMNTNGDRLVIRGSGTMTSTVQTKQIRLRLVGSDAATDVAFLFSTANVSLTFDYQATIVRDSSTTFRAGARCFFGAAGTPEAQSDYNTGTPFDFTASMQIYSSLQSVVDGTITQGAFSVDLFTNPS